MIWGVGLETDGLGCLGFRVYRCKFWRLRFGSRSLPLSVEV